MPQIVIDPQQVGIPEEQVSINVLPEDVRRFGFVPKFSDCKPGDLILFSRNPPDLVTRFIDYAQRRAGFDAQHSRWTHAAIFLYEDFVVEAVPGSGVRTRSVYSDVPYRTMRVRRQPRLTEIERYKIALRAQRMLGSRYSTMPALQIGIAMILGLWNRAVFPHFRSATICSEAFYDAHAEITRSLLQDTARRRHLA